MKNRKSQGKVFFAGTAVLLAAIIALACGADNAFAQTSSAHQSTGRKGGSKVYFTSDLSPAGIQAVYDALGLKASGKVAVKVSTGEPPASNYLRQDLIGPFVKSVNGTYVECMTAYGGKRAAAASSKQVAADHGFAPFELLDEKSTIELSTPKASRNIKETIVGAGISNYNFLVTLSHFKGHAMGGFGGAIKNLSIGFGSKEGKAWIHSGGTSKTKPWGGKQDAFLESMAEAAGAVINNFGKNNIYINVMNRLSVDCDCNGNPAQPDMHDIGILASLDPVALDKACVDLVYKAADGKSLVRRMERQNGELQVIHAAEIGLGSLQYELVKLD